MVVGTNRYFDFSDVERVEKLVGLFFRDGRPYQPHIGTVRGELRELKTMRNWSAHITSTTQKKLDQLAESIFLVPTSVSLYQLLTAIDPRVAGGATTVYAKYKAVLLITAELIARGAR